MKAYPYPCPTPNQGGYTAIMKAAANGHHGTVNHLIAKGANINAQSTVRSPIAHRS